ncbi:hypothetical protein E2562_035951 [Oryza meyeriana var. granulata]|uniref:Uncharacterized protein n=1 Tax=Oryza meyeriana var. granulata TaxID=110450 RepID=A0A6G1FG85_9ORYZ|nr:hypothetical protein E2562_035951 [Oryza meyeriana var. granulata]
MSHIWNKHSVLKYTTGTTHFDPHFQSPMAFVPQPHPSIPLTQQMQLAVDGSQSVVSEGKSNALDVSFVRAPIGMDLDWQLVAKISPCHVMVLKASYERFLEFIKRSKAVSPTVTMETATALQANEDRAGHTQSSGAASDGTGRAEQHD